MTGHFQQAIANHQKMIDELFAEEAKKKKDDADKASRKAESQRLTVRFMEDLIDSQIKIGQLKSSTVEIVLTHWNKLFGLEETQAYYVSIVVKLLTHDFYGVESASNWHI
ncbi:hypothetical protein LC653_41535 [Nostoc sp. CHAB 5784]|uniref:hypothetical protein n=1 Tax=Nostoc mirabile TaxID=2907820 RepID=UPI001E588313|nr:hypothetical protein [Nostoc mirabile]MCC5670108.1 hypothetical protein [Nostoc mirabile CHAB5784]